ncbi:MAG: isopentenyl-diphosphate Delta-isomerase [Hyphomicrobiales bacterium]|nr:isopentenyl-diphosphate Delta-isomerase [Hyphomicrobiales bacterium]
MAEERLILIDERNRAVGVGGKSRVHRQGLLHRAFSIFIVDARGRILLQRRSLQKYHSGGLLANSCCGHPRPGETTLVAAHRRLREELGLSSALTFAFFSRYRADLDNGMQENEFVYVYFGPLTATPAPDPAEVSDIEWVSAERLGQRIRRRPHDYTYWLRHYLASHGAAIARHARATAARGGAGAATRRRSS